MISLLSRVIGILLVCCLFAAPALAQYADTNPLRLFGKFTEEEAAQICSDCTPAERRALVRLFNGSSQLSKQSKVSNTGYGVRIHNNCLPTFGEKISDQFQRALGQGIMCLSQNPTQTSRALIREMAEVLAAQDSPAPVLMCRELATKTMKGVASRSTSRKKAPVVSINTALVGEREQEIRSVLFHEFLHLGGDGHSHGTSREVVTPCQYCCFSATRFSLFSKPQACRACKSDYEPGDYKSYLDDLESWALKTPGMEYLYRVNLIDSVKRAGGDTEYLADVLRQFKDHPFGFELSRKVYKRYKWTTLTKRRIRAITRKSHGHITKQYVPLAQALSDALVLRFEQKADAENTIKELTKVLGNSSLPRKVKLSNSDQAFFNKYYYEFALMRGVLAAEVYTYWKGVYKSSNCPANPSNIAALSGEQRNTCERLYSTQKKFQCQKSGLDFDDETMTCAAL